MAYHSLQSVLLFCLFAANILAAPNLYKIYQRYSTSKYPHLQKTKLTEQLPAKETVQQEMQHYYALFQENQQMKEIDTTGDPNLNTHFILYNTVSEGQQEKSIREKQTIFVMGKQLAKMFVEVTLVNEHDQQTHISKNEEEGAYIVIYNTEDAQILSYKYISRNRAFLLDINTDLYAIQIFLPSFISQNPQNKEQKPYSKAKIDLKVAISEANKQSFIEYFQQYESTLRRMHNEASKIFLDSLEKWDIIAYSEAKYYEHENSWLWYSAGQLAIFFIFGAIELLYLKRLLGDSHLVV